ncbi:flavin-nucleotide-binding protein [Zhengella mangrovi]|uniref:Flavin-nucleotide-binding protein n=1 Tax=Zhengella mangrovi TaxID=1982044 RepID=A0A2G1QHC3_9HYPH|nr:pyridoxamine 5'-phosphate oxidase family protein [Zhengella mangrovi]PHP64916.1 flavin-nucleotide-binding protein [Zhengella mangrovi]
MSIITSLEELQALYGEPGLASTAKVLDHVNEAYGAFIKASPFALLATAGEGGLDCSPRGDRPGFVTIENPRTLLMPDRQGNNRVDSLANIVTDGRVGLLFLVPGSDTTLRVNGRAEVSVARALTARFAVDGKVPRSVLVIHVAEVYFQCARALMRSNLWADEARVDPSSLPTAGEMLAAASNGAAGGAGYDAAWPERAKSSMW